ncbi:MAG: response regulator [Candidatus Moranbacteria bacterium]|nr:response regulator [Candidatus Moranbacteria bacterium]
MTKVLIAEDDLMISEIYQKKFTENGYEVLAAFSGDQVLEIVKKEKIDIILLDLLLPKLDGFQVTEALRSGKYDPNIKIIIFSNMSQKEDQEKVMALGANGFITKAQYTPSEMVEEIKRLTGIGN